MNKNAPPLAHCDMVMKGGITSGVVYPRAIVKLAEKFVFKNLGGTSAGAIAAAAAAVAERTRGSAKGGFRKLAGLPDLLIANPAGAGSNLFRFFQPEAATGRLFRLAISALTPPAERTTAAGEAVSHPNQTLGSVRRVVLTALSEYPGAAFLGALPGLVYGLATGSESEGSFFLASIVVAAFLGLLGVAVGLVIAIGRDLSGALPQNFYGLCSGMGPMPADATGSETASAAQLALTPWLTQYFDEFFADAPLGHPVTFGDLWDTADPDKPRRVNLEMMTTCLTHGRPYRLPFRNDSGAHENGLFYFREEEFRRFFPASIVDWMIAHPRATRDKPRRDRLLEAGFFPLPEPADLPIVVAVRMSLSFPVLLSAVPLHAIDRSRDELAENPERCWFTDGGVCSNFPLHFFDSPLPRWPTLSLDLVDRPRGTPAVELAQPEMAADNNSRIFASWNRFEIEESVDATTGSPGPARQKSGLERLLAFGGAFVKTMQNWTDSTQAGLPGYRDRIAGIKLTPDEGGLNLNMPSKLIGDLTVRGAAAADAFIERFAPPPPPAAPSPGAGKPGPVPSALPAGPENDMDWTNHRRVRLRSGFASIEKFLERIDQACSGALQPGDPSYEDLIRAIHGSGGGYPWKNVDQRDRALAVLKALRAASNAPPSASLNDDAPNPRPELRPRPPL